ncbi:MAG: rRNA pseudouridine synthase [bacterium]|nr:rRNA pseudouridine synthase [bacterium]
MSKSPDRALKRGEAQQPWLPGRPMGLSRALMKAGYGTRRWADAAVKAGRVRVGDDVVTDPLRMIATDTVVFLDNKPLAKVEPAYYAFHKPLRVVCRQEDGPGRRLVEDFLPDDVIGLRTAGRLDSRTSGLLLVANDGAWITRVTSVVDCEHEFTVQVEGEVSDVQLTVIDAGIVVPGLGTFRPVSVKVLSRERGRTMLSLTLRGGQARQMRRMLATLRHKVLMVRRVRLGGVTLGDLAPGGLRPLTAQEIGAFAPKAGASGPAARARRRDVRTR